MNSTLLSVIAGLMASLSVGALILGFQRVIKPAGEMDDRLEHQFGQEAPTVARQPRSLKLPDLLKGTSLEKRLGGKAGLELAQADLALTVSEFATFRVVGAIAGFVVGILFMRSALMGLPLAILGMQIPVLLVHSRRGKRQKMFQKQLVDVLSMLVSALRAGIGFGQALEMVRREMPAPAGDEFGRVVKETGLGVSQHDALRHLQERMPGDDLAMIVTVVNIQSEVGGNLADVLDGVVVTIRERVRIAQEIRTLTAQQRIAGYMLAAMPFLVGFAVMVINPDFMMPLFSPEWIWLPGIALVMIFIGFFFITRIVDIKV